MRLKVINQDFLNPEQRILLNRPFEGSQYLEGPAGAGKTTVGILRAIKLIEAGNNARTILILVPQRRLGIPYLQYFTLEALLTEIPEIITIAGLARRMVELFWPLIGEKAGFSTPEDPPKFLTLETAQYYMSRVVGPYLDEGYFEGLSLDRYRLYRQILDNLNKASVVGFPLSEIGPRLSEAWVGADEQSRVYDQAQHCAEQFRAACYNNNLVDFSLQYELFFRYVEILPEFKRYFSDRYKHLIADNLEEETPQGHDYLARWLTSFKSALLISDRDGGYSRFLGADPNNLQNLQGICDRTDQLEASLMMSEPVRQFSLALVESIYGRHLREADFAMEGIQVHSSTYLPELIEWVIEETAQLIHRGYLPSEIAIVSPFVSDSLRFLLTHRLDQKNIPWESHRPSRAIADDAFNRCLLTIAAIAYPDWGAPPSRDRVAQMLMMAIDGMDLVRASLLASILYRISEGVSELSTFLQLRPEMEARIGFNSGEKYERLREWIITSRQSPIENLDQFFNRLFGELLSQPGFGFHDNMDAGRAAAAMITSIQKFRSVMRNTAVSEPALGREYYKLIQEGALAAQYLTNEGEVAKEAVFISPAFTYLTMDRRSKVQFWLDVGSPAWAERLYQPLTHPYVLSRHWERGRKWTDEDEWNVRREIAATLTTGLIRRCGDKVYLCHSAYGEQGVQQQGVLLNAIQRLLSLKTHQEGSGSV